MDKNQKSRRLPGIAPVWCLPDCARKRLPSAKTYGVGVRIDKRDLDALCEREKILPEGPGKILERSRAFIGNKSK